MKLLNSCIYVQVSKSDISRSYGKQNNDLFIFDLCIFHTVKQDFMLFKKQKYYKMLCKVAKIKYQKNKTKYVKTTHRNPNTDLHHRETYGDASDNQSTCMCKVINEHNIAVLTTVKTNGVGSCELIQ